MWFDHAVMFHSSRDADSFDFFHKDAFLDAMKQI